MSQDQADREEMKLAEFGKEGLKQAPAMCILLASFYLFLSHVEQSEAHFRQDRAASEERLIKVTERQDATIQAQIQSMIEISKVLDRCDRTMKGMGALDQASTPSERLMPILEDLSGT